MDGVFQQRCSANAWDHINVRGYQPPGPDAALSSSSYSVSSEDRNDMDLDGFSGGFGHSFEEKY